MNVQDDVRLDYVDPPVPPGLAEQARTRGRRVRRRRRAAAVTGATAVVVGAVLGAQSFLALPVPGVAGPARSVQDVSALPASSGAGPRPQRTSPPAFGATMMDEGGMLPLGEVFQVDTVRNDDGRYDAVWVSRSGALCFGGWTGRGQQTSPGACASVNRLPAEGFWGSAAASSAHADLAEPSPQRTVVYGVVRGPVTRVVVDLPEGPTEAHLAPLTDSNLGTLYWTVTTSYDTAYRSDDGFVNFQDSVSRTAYRGDTAVFHCQEAGCPRSDG